MRAYDDLDHKISEVTPQGEVRYTYDNAGLRTSLIIKNGAPGAQVAQPTITYTYDKANRLTRISQAAGIINANQAQNILFAYDLARQWTKLTLANGSVTDHTYDAAGQLTKIVYKKSNGTAIGDLQYAYDAGGHKISVNGSLARLNAPAADIVDATYDVSNRLTRWGGKVYSYDDDGSLIGDGTNTYQWSERNRLVSITAGTSTLASFQYDSVGRRTAKTVGSTTTGFLYDGSNIAQELLGIHNTDAVKAHLLTGGTDALFLRIEGNDGTKRNSVFSDANSNAVMLMDAAQQPVVSYTYEPYGMTTADTGNANTQQYTSRENDVVGNGQGLYYYRARYYMPGTARFVSEDPIGWTSGQANNYAYVGGNPIDFRDPFGLEVASGFENVSAGIGDGLTFGLTRWSRKKLGIDGVNTCSGLYAGGIVRGVGGLALATGGLAGGVEAGEAAAAEGAEALAEEEAVAGARARRGRRTHRMPSIRTS
ncbi:MAG: RHS repeat-associated core domain-containing protein [Kofleriaceae bacterium]